MEKTSSGLQENVASLLCYVGWWVSGLIFILIEKDNKTVRFHAFQSILTFAAITILWIVFAYILWWLYWIFWILGIVLWIVLMVRAYQGQKLKLPVIGDLAEQWANK